MLLGILITEDSYKPPGGEKNFVQFFWREIPGYIKKGNFFQGKENVSSFSAGMQLTIHGTKTMMIPNM